MNKTTIEWTDYTSNLIKYRDPAFAAPWVPEFGANWAPRLTSRKGSNPDGWPEDLRMRQYPDV